MIHPTRLMGPRPLPTQDRENKQTDALAPMARTTDASAPSHADEAGSLLVRDGGFELLLGLLRFVGEADLGLLGGRFSRPAFSSIAGGFNRVSARSRSVTIASEAGFRTHSHAR